MINCIIVDDEPLARDVLEDHISKTDTLHLVKKCANALEAFEAINNNTIDLMFMDIKMPAVNGIDFMRSLKNPPAVIFTTAYAEHAAASYDLEAVDYLLKPITYDRFTQSMARFFKQQPKPETSTAYTYFKVNGKLVKLLHADIITAQSIKDYIIINTTLGNYITHMTMKYLECLLPQMVFKRVHRSFIINVMHITAIGKGQIVLQDQTIPVGQRYRKEAESIRSGLRH